MISYCPQNKVQYQGLWGPTWCGPFYLSSAILCTSLSSLLSVQDKDKKEGEGDEEG